MTKTKACRLCGTVKPRSDFDRESKMKDGYRNECRSCRVKQKTQRAARNRAALKKSAAAFAARHTHKTCSRCCRTLQLASFSVCTARPDGLQNYCKVCARTSAAADRQASLSRRRAYERAYEQSERGKARARHYCKSNPHRRIANALRARLGSALRASLAGQKTKRRDVSAVRDLDCTIHELMAHLEAKFQPGMSWDNYGDWQIDHIVPLAAFDLTDSWECALACHFSNLQPLWATDNSRKGAKCTLAVV